MQVRGVAAVGGIIPANTGRIFPKWKVVKVITDHPREYGENERACSNPKFVEGSSPRIRGE